MRGERREQRVGTEVTDAANRSLKKRRNRVTDFLLAGAAGYLLSKVLSDFGVPVVVRGILAGGIALAGIGLYVGDRIRRSRAEKRRNGGSART